MIIKTLIIILSQLLLDQVLYFVLFFYCNIFYVNFPDYKLLIPNKYYTLILSAFLLTFISLLDDIKSIDPILRLILQIFTVYISITTLDLNNFDIPAKVLILFSVVIWIYITNITNFLDGSDGYLASIFLFVILNIFLINYVSEIKTFSLYISLIISPAIIIFIFFNMPPAKIYMGVSGSIFLGFLFGFFTLELISMGHFVLAISIISYPLTDCTTTLVKKLFKGYMPWVGLYDYYFLKPVIRNKINHKNVFLISIIFNIFNSINIFMILKTNLNYLLLFSFVLSFVQIYIYSNLEDKLRILKFFR